MRRTPQLTVGTKRLEIADFDELGPSTVRNGSRFESGRGLWLYSVHCECPSPFVRALASSPRPPHAG
jgi:hypothetical protein